ncbi:translocation and assembly module lipoprotein TamL [Daejeonella oryzae]|uniref:translocation and assembly module lipoprotein TamL n=1 Tax=Daejeonella oryzae TaxID=1122943 RepID=UPI00047CE2C0|nr:BamA/TamA family outer membrane protein [Daejeonella oryzae]
MSSCNASRFLPDDQALVKKVNIKGIDKQFSEQAFLYVQKEARPNSRLNLALYNTFNTKKGAYRTDRIRKIGEAPHILDSSLVEISRTQIERFLESKGFFNAEVKSDISIKNKKASILFTANPGPEFKIRSIDYLISDSAVAAIYAANREKFTHIHSGARYDSDSLNYEREQIFLMMKRNGYYDYVRQYVRFDVDSNLYSSQADLKLFLANPKERDFHPVYTINQSTVSIKNSNGEISAKADTAIIDSQYRFVDHSGKFNPGLVNRFLFIKQGDKYDISKEELTYDRLYDLNVFKNIKIEYSKTGDSTLRLNPRIEIIPLKKMSNRIEGEYTFNSGRNGFNIGDTYTNRNLFGGAELLEVKVKYGILFDATVKQSLVDRIFSRDFQIGANFTVPKLLSPIRVPQFGKNGIPHTTISSSFQLFDQKNAFSNRVFINSITYDWVETKYKFHSLTPINIELRKGRLDPGFRDSLLDRGFLLYVRTNDRQFFNLSSQYAYTYNTPRLNTYGNFLYFRGNIDLGGNTMGLIAKVLKFEEDQDGYKTIFNLPFQQYVKLETDVRMYRFFGGEKQFVARLNPGIGIPYGNSSALTFEKNFFAGGSSGIRAWQARTLGPGNYNRAVLSSDELRTNLRNLDQLGELKLEGNLEYRFRILNSFLGSKVKGATFTDFGNIWRLRETVENPGGEFKFNKFLNQIAIGTGAGLRFDLNYFVLRLDAGLKVKDPQFTGSDQWVIKYLFNYKDFKDRYEKITNTPDKYRLVQYNFGIGMPF